MKALRLGLFLVWLLQWANGFLIPTDQLDGSGDGIIEQGQFPLGEDYVNCPPDLTNTDDYLYDFDQPNIILDDVLSSVENSSVEVVDQELLENTEKPNASSAKVEISSSDIPEVESDKPITFRLLSSSNLYSLSESEPVEARYAAFLIEHPEEIEITSPNYPEAYPNTLNDYKEYSVPGSAGVIVTIHDLNVDPDSDFLYIRGGSTGNGPSLNGFRPSPVRLLFPNTNTFTVHFISDHYGVSPHNFRGFRLTYAPYVSEEDTTTDTTTVEQEEEDIEWFEQTVLSNNSLFDSSDERSLIKAKLVDASNAFIEKYQPNYRLLSPDDIRFVVRRCPDTWPKHEECATLKFAVPLRPNLTQIDSDYEAGAENNGIGGLGKLGYIQITTTEAPDPPYQLSEHNLELMWNEFGAKALAEVGIEAYKLPESSSIVFIWIAISLCVVAAFIFVLYSIWKIDIFKDYRRISKMSRDAQDEDRNELKKKEFDISMFPSPHQIVPSLFPTGDPFVDRRSTDAYYAYDNSTMNPWAEELNGAFDDNSKPPAKKNSYEPFSPAPMDFSPVDFNEPPENYSPQRNRMNPFQPPMHELNRSSGPESGAFRQSSSQA